jgi:hypothetical protein
MDERLRFVARLLDGEKMAPFFGQFGDPEVAAVGQELDEELERLLLNTAN